MKLLGQGQTFELAVLQAFQNTVDVLDQHDPDGHWGRAHKIESSVINATVTYHSVLVDLKNKTISHHVELEAKI